MNLSELLLRDLYRVQIEAQAQMRLLLASVHHLAHDRQVLCCYKVVGLAPFARTVQRSRTSELSVQTGQVQSHIPRTNAEK
jgi:hypothetical protein